MATFEWLYYIIVISALIWVMGRSVLVIPAMVAVMCTLALAIGAIGVP